MLRVMEALSMSVHHFYTLLIRRLPKKMDEGNYRKNTRWGEGMFGFWMGSGCRVYLWSKSCLLASCPINARQWTRFLNARNKRRRRSGVSDHTVATPHNAATALVSSAVAGRGFVNGPGLSLTVSWCRYFALPWVGGV